MTSNPASASDKDKWPFDPMQPGDHEPVRIPDDHPAKKKEC
jgi:hypothetical protein